jgi:hypothetical protein
LCEGRLVVHGFAFDGFDDVHGSSLGLAIPGGSFVIGWNGRWGGRWRRSWPPTLLEQIRPALGRALARAALAPALDARVIAGEQHLGHFQAAEDARAGEVRMLEQAVAEALLDCRRLVAEHAWDQPHAGFELHHRRGFAARQLGAEEVPLGCVLLPGPNDFEQRLDLMTAERHG